MQCDPWQALHRLTTVIMSMNGNDLGAVPNDSDVQHSDEESGELVQTDHPDQEDSDDASDYFVYGQDENVYVRLILKVQRIINKYWRHFARKGETQAQPIHDGVYADTFPRNILVYQGDDAASRSATPDIDRGDTRHLQRREHMALRGTFRGVRVLIEAKSYHGIWVEILFTNVDRERRFDIVLHDDDLQKAFEEGEEEDQKITRHVNVMGYYEPGFVDECMKCMHDCLNDRWG